MLITILSIAAIIAAIAIKQNILNNKIKNMALRGALIILGVLGLLSRSFITVDSNEVGHLKRIYFAQNLPPGQIIASNGEKGPQSEVVGPGFHLIPLVKILYDIEYAEVVEIPEGSYGLLYATDGLPLRSNQFLADPWPDDQFKQMLNASYFLNEGKGQKGPQSTVLKPGRYRLNRYLFKVKVKPALDVPTGHVAVIRSNIQTAENCPDALVTQGKTGASIATPTVPVGCIGVENEPRPPGRYYLNEKAYVATIIPTRLQTWVYKGGYVQRKINLRVGDDGTITQEETSVKMAVPKNAADRAITVRVEGWTVPVDMRVVVQVHPRDAPQVVASIGDLQRVEDNIITPAIRDILRTIGGAPGRRVLDFVENRDKIVSLVESAIAIEGKKAGVTIQEVRMGEPAIPPELLVATLREQLASQLKATYQRERDAQQERIKVERERATANQQTKLVEAEIAEKAAKHRKNQLQLEGEGEKLKLMEIARGQEAQARVLGKDRAMQLQALEKTLAAAIQNPAIVKVPSVLVNGSGSSLEGAAAILGASNLVSSTQSIKNSAK